MPLLYKTKTRAIIEWHKDGSRTHRGYEHYREPTLFTDVIGLVSMLGIVACAVYFIVAFGGVQ